jgi:hypothetical protein
VLLFWEAVFRGLASQWNSPPPVLASISMTRTIGACRKPLRRTKAKSTWDTCTPTTPRSGQHALWLEAPSCSHHCFGAGSVAPLIQSPYRHHSITSFTAKASSASPRLRATSGLLMRLPFRRAAALRSITLGAIIECRPSEYPRLSAPLCSIGGRSGQPSRPRRSALIPRLWPR